MPGNIPISPDFQEFIELLNVHKVRYLIVGGYALAFHGHPRYTKDMDVWIEPTKTNAVKILQVLNDFGFASLQFSLKDCMNPDNVIQLGSPPYRIDLIFELDGVEFKTCYSNKMVLTIKDLKINFIDLENLRKNKKATARPQDIVDLERLAPESS
ncbi:hypothetical protein JXQ31_06310 [candidate division KSB1 bacterium]|nr:hypothetical protein [candidate division KSB1 bacterium]